MHKRHTPNTQSKSCAFWHDSSAKALRPKAAASDGIAAMHRSVIVGRIVDCESEGAGVSGSTATDVGAGVFGATSDGVALGDATGPKLGAFWNALQKLSKLSSSRSTVLQRRQTPPEQSGDATPLHIGSANA